ncbi:MULTISPECIES: HAD-IA family hydrolase [Streptomyces]|uniref:HAD-IA family hydrolase n=1 Tax=Streptomyces TaxID=1883 RepID=UPI002E7BD7DF|nr:HAD-IA family hydrolase [Streptomyces huasconensis]
MAPEPSVTLIGDSRRQAGGSRTSRGAVRRSRPLPRGRALAGSATSAAGRRVCDRGAVRLGFGTGALGHADRRLAAAGRRIALLSNIPERLAVHYEERHAWLKPFQVRAFSCRIGHAKPEPGAYRWCLDALGTEAGRVLFVDDREENVRAAEAGGLRGHLFTIPADLREALRKEPRLSA